MARLPWLLLPLIGCLPAASQVTHPWALAGNPHFEVYAEAGPESARTVLAWFEQLRSWITQETGLVRAEGRIIHRGRTVATADGHLRDGAGRLYAHATTTCMIFPAK